MDICTCTYPRCICCWIFTVSHSALHQPGGEAREGELGVAEAHHVAYAPTCREQVSNLKASVAQGVEVRLGVEELEGEEAMTIILAHLTG